MESKTKMVHHKNPYFKVSIISNAIVFTVAQIIAVVQKQEFYAIIGMVFPSVVLILIIMKHPWQKLMIKLWSGYMGAGSVLELALTIFGYIFMDESLYVINYRIAYALLNIGIFTPIFFYTNSNIEIQSSDDKIDPVNEMKV
ncbi:MAG TPA: hypothetical protein VK186_12760 [Candidatus Deferrimicrobium sp.]|nr:hypothetical protein [Candidatus Deferrimicrobium sp.]